MHQIDQLLVANRGEIAIRIMRAAEAEGIGASALYTTDDAAALHVIRASSSHALPGAGVSGYLDIDAIIDAAKVAGADAVHPGYGFLAENAEFARAVELAGLTFVGPGPDLLDLFGDKVAARRAATVAGVPVLAGSDGPCT
ncbi:MAG: biotin carboxylase N-terminal domain-containing protein, partial [Acidimicrobiales bacterium]